MNQEEQQHPYLVELLLHIAYSIGAFPKMLLEGIVGLITAFFSDREIFMLIVGVALLTLVLPWEFVVGGGLIFYAILRTINAWLDYVSARQAEQLNFIGQVMNREKRVAVVQLPEILLRPQEQTPYVDVSPYDSNET